MKKEFALVTVTAVTTLLLLVGCGVKVRKNGDGS